MAVSYARHRITVDEYHRMDAAGIFAPDARIELIDGELIETVVSMNPPHAASVGALNRRLTITLGDRAYVRCQLPVTLGDASEPEPDLAIVRLPLSRYHAWHPSEEDVFCLIEVADSSRHFDLGRKVPIYAEFGIPEAWIVDLSGRRIHVFRDPCDRAYASEAIVSVRDAIALQAFPDIAFTGADILL